MRAVLQSRWLQLKPYRRPLITDCNSPPLTAAVRGGIVWGQEARASTPTRKNVTILETITQIDSAYDPDPNGVINATGTTADGREVDLWIYNTGDGPLVGPGASFLPYGGIYYNPWPLASIRES